VSGRINFLADCEALAGCRGAAMTKDFRGSKGIKSLCKDTE